MTRMKLPMFVMTTGMLLLSACFPPPKPPPPPPPGWTDPEFQEEIDRLSTEYFDTFMDRVRPVNSADIQVQPDGSTIVVPGDSALKDAEVGDILVGDLDRDGQQELAQVMSVSAAPGQPGDLVLITASFTPDLSEFVKAGDLFFTDAVPFTGAQISEVASGVTASATSSVLTLTFNNAALCGPSQPLRVNGNLQLQLVYRLAVRLRQGPSGPLLRAEYVTEWKQSGSLSAQGACNGTVQNTLAKLNLPVRSPLLGELPLPTRRLITLTLNAEGNQTGQIAFGASYNDFTQTQGGRFNSPPDTWTPVDTVSGSVARAGAGSDARGSGSVTLTLAKTVRSSFYDDATPSLTSVTRTALRFQAGSPCFLSSLSSGDLGGRLSFLRDAPVNVELVFPERAQELGCGTLTEPPPPPPPPPPPSTEVTNLNDSGAGSLRAVLDGVPSGSTVTFKSGLSGTIALQSPLSLDKNVVIDGPDGEPQISLSGQGATQHLNVAPGATVTVQDLTMTQGWGNPAGSIVNAGTLNLSRTVVQNSVGTDVGGILNTGVLTLSDSRVLNNSALRTGGIASSGDVTVSGSSVISGNRAEGAASVLPEGGGVRMNAGTLFLNANVRIESNRASRPPAPGADAAAQGRGGGVAMPNCQSTGARLVMAPGSRITLNVAGSYPPAGGGIAAQSTCLSGVIYEPSPNVVGNEPDNVAPY